MRCTAFAYSSFFFLLRPTPPSVVSNNRSQLRPNVAVDMCYPVPGATVWKILLRKNHRRCKLWLSSVLTLARNPGDTLEAAHF